MKGEIIYSKYDSNEVTEALDFVLDTRDKLFFDNIFQNMVYIYYVFCSHLLIQQQILFFEHTSYYYLKTFY